MCAMEGTCTTNPTDTAVRSNVPTCMRLSAHADEGCMRTRTGEEEGGAPGVSACARGSWSLLHGTNSAARCAHAAHARVLRAAPCAAQVLLSHTPM